MKKALLPFLLLASELLISQNAYKRTEEIKYSIYNGTRVSYVNLFSVLGIDSSNSIYSGPTAIINDYNFNPGTVGVLNLNTLEFSAYSSFSSFHNIYTLGEDSVHLIPSERAGLMTLAYATPIISAMTTSITGKADASNVYSKSASDSRYLQSFTEVDGSSTNEIQTLSINSSSISLSNGGGTVVIPTNTLTALTSSTGISITSGSVITNTSPMITQTITGANGITISSSANTFTVSKTKRQETYSGTTNSSGTYTVSFGTAYSVAPNIQANIISGTANQIIVITSISTTGFTINVYQRNAVTLLATEVLLASTVNVNGASVDVVITEK